MCWERATAANLLSLLGLKTAIKVTYMKPLSKSYSLHCELLLNFPISFIDKDFFSSFFCKYYSWGEVMAFGQNFIPFMKKSVTYWTFVKLKNRKWHTYFIGKAINLPIFYFLKRKSCMIRQKGWLGTYQLWFISFKKP